MNICISLSESSGPSLLPRKPCLHHAWGAQDDVECISLGNLMGSLAPSVPKTSQHADSNGPEEVG